jgi:hypothetical protein
MGGIFGRRKKTQFDPNSPFYDPYNPGGLGVPPPGYGGPPPGYGGPPPGYTVPPPYPYGGYDPYSRYGEYDPMDIYGYGYSPTESFESFYGGPMGRGPYNYGGRYGRGKISKIEMKNLLRKFLCRI